MTFLAHELDSDGMPVRIAAYLPDIADGIDPEELPDASALRAEGARIAPFGSTGLDSNELAAALTDGMGSVAPDRRAGAIACRVLAFLVRNRADGFEHLSQAEAAKMLGVSPSAVSRAGDRVEEALAVHRRRASQRRMNHTPLVGGRRGILIPLVASSRRRSPISRT